MAAAALEVGADPEDGQEERVVAWQAAHRVSSISPTSSPFGRCSTRWCGLEVLGDLTAYQAADVALASYPSSGQNAERDELTAAVLRPAQVGAAQRQDPVIEATGFFALLARRPSGWRPGCGSRWICSGSPADRRSPCSSPIRSPAN